MRTLSNGNMSEEYECKVIQEEIFGVSKHYSKVKFPAKCPVAHIYNPSYSGGRDQDVHSLKPV
jgi:hypothetical protein